jgi:hypothetical protein
MQSRSTRILQILDDIEKISPIMEANALLIYCLAKSTMKILLSNKKVRTNYIKQAF